MKRFSKILSIGFTSILLFINIGLTLTLNHGLHAHFTGNNQILIHYHTTGGADKPHHSNDSNCPSHFSFSTTITYLNNAQGININIIGSELHCNVVLPNYNCHYKKHLNNSPLRAPPLA